MPVPLLSVQPRGCSQVGEIVFGDYLIMLYTRDLFLKNHSIYSFESKFMNFFLFSFFYHRVEHPFLPSASIRFIQNIVEVAKHPNTVNGQDERLRRRFQFKEMVLAIMRNEEIASTAVVSTRCDFSQNTALPMM